MDENPEIRHIRSSTLTALIQVIGAVFGSILHQQRKGKHDEAMNRIVFMEHLLLHALSTLQQVRAKVEGDTPPLTEAEVDAFAAELASMPDGASDS